MAELRFSALREVFDRKPLEIENPSGNLSDLFGTNVFDLPKMERYLPKEAYKAVKTAIETGTSINRQIADQVCYRTESVGTRKGGNTLYTLVPSSYRCYCRKT